MKPLRLLLCLVLTTMLLSSCNPRFDCQEINSFSSFDNTVSITGLKMVENLVLYYPDKDERLEWGELIVVRDSADYAWLAEASVNDTCMDCFFPWLPLDTAVLLGVPMELNCLEYNYLKVVDDVDRTIFQIKTLDPTECETYTCPNRTFNWVLAPKSKVQDLIEFQGGRHYYRCDCN